MASLLLFLLRFLLPCAAAAATASSAAPPLFRFPLTHRDSPASLLRSPFANPSDLPASMPLRGFVASGRAMKIRAQEQQPRRRRRRAAVASSSSSIQGRFTYLSETVGDFYLMASVGQPAQEVILALDTGSELTWTQCLPCRVCSRNGGPSFAYDRSESYERVPCTSPLCTQSLGFSGGCSNSSQSCIFQLQYGDGSIDAGYISVDQFRLGEGNVSRSLVFGCAVIDMDTVPVPISGILGLNAGPFSFVSQLLSGQDFRHRKFAYCLPNRFRDLEARGLIEFGDYAAKPAMVRTPFSPPYAPLGDLYYYVSLVGFTVGRRRIRLSSIANSSSGGGGGGNTIFDSGTAITHLVSPVYGAFLGEIHRQTRSLHPFSLHQAGGDLCYRLPESATELPALPNVIFHFAGSADLVLEPEALLYAAAVQGHEIIVCLAFLNSTSSGIQLNIVGNYQQQDYWVEYDLQGSSVGFARVASCPGA